MSQRSHIVLWLVAVVIGHAVQLAPAAADAPASAAWTVAADAPFSAAELQRDGADPVADAARRAERASAGIANIRALLGE